MHINNFLKISVHGKVQSPGFTETQFFFREGSISTVNYFHFPQFHFTQLQVQVVQAEALKAEKASMSDEMRKLKEELGAVRDRLRATEKQVSLQERVQSTDSQGASPRRKVCVFIDIMVATIAVARTR